MRVASLFSGVGGMDWGFEVNPLFEIVFANDFEPTACQTYLANFRDAQHHLRQGSIVDFINEVPKHDVLLGGFPCQAFSLAGKREGFDDSQGRGLHYENCKKVLELRKPSFFVFENVGGILSHDGGKSLEAINAAFRDVGYNLHLEKINMSDYGVPQRRVRVIFFGVRQDLNIDPKTLVPPHPKVDKEVLKVKHILGEHNKIFPPLTQSFESCTRWNHNFHVGNGKTKLYWIKIVRNPGENLHNMSTETIRQRQNELLAKEGVPCRVAIPKSVLGYRRLDDNTVAPTMMFGNTCLPIHPYEDRSISVREAAYLQSFPLDFVFKGGISAQYKQVGNAVPPLFSVHLANHLEKIIKGY